ncbi:MAG: DUF2490 domain-containing protein [Flavobacteriaceae bacterium]|nr:DUF2490 domain-containing protein [Flavobacteriaceae bacterium]
MKFYQILFILSLFTTMSSYSQVVNESDNWDNELWTGTRFAWGGEKLKYTAEYQTRFTNNFKNLDRWYIEGALHYLGIKHLEIVPDFRYNVREINNEYRIGLGFVFKYTFNKFMFVNQLKGQMDKAENTKETYALREVIYINYLLNEKWIPYVGGGIFLRKSDNFNGLQVIRAGAGVLYNFDPLHSIGVNYFVGQRNLGDRKVLSGIFLIQLTLKFNNNYIYQPAKYINF